jgi:hypothetical protein
MDIHQKVEGLTGEAVAAAHAKDLEVQDKYGVKYLQYWFDEGSGRCSAWSRLPAKRRQHGSTARPMACKPMKSSRFRKESKTHDVETRYIP